VITLPFPSAKLSGHNNGSWYDKRHEVKKHREWAKTATLAAKPSVPALGDIPIHFRFIPPDRRSDRMNFTNRLKPYADGIADALGVNDVRFLPSFEFCPPEKPGKVEVFIGEKPAVVPGEDGASVLDKERAGSVREHLPSPDHNRLATGGD